MQTMTNKGTFIMKNSIPALGIIGTILFFFSMVGLSQAVTFPDENKVHGSQGPGVSKTPGKRNNIRPTPYPDIVKNSGASKGRKKIVVDKKGVTTKSKFKTSMGDEPGTQKGLISQKNMDKIKFKKGSSKVKTEGKNVVHSLNPKMHN